IFHTGKMWVLSILLVFWSMLALYRALKERKKNTEQASRAAFWSVFTACAASANFPLAAIFLINIPILAYVCWRDRVLFASILRGLFYGGALLVLILVVNFGNIKHQVLDVFTNYHPLVTSTVSSLPQIGYGASLLLHGWQVLVAFPLVLALCCMALYRRALRSPLLFSVS